MIHDFSFVLRLKELGKIGKLDGDCDFYILYSKLPNDVIANSQWYVLIFPHYAKELVGFEDFLDFFPQTEGGTLSGILTGLPLYFMYEDNWIGAWNDNLSGGFR